MLDRILKEYKDKLDTGDVNELLKAPTYAMIIVYLQTHDFDEEWAKKLESEKNILDFLFEKVSKNRVTLYENVADVLVFEQISY